MPPRPNSACRRKRRATSRPAGAVAGPSARRPGTVGCPSPAAHRRRPVPPRLLPRTSKRAFIPANNGGRGVACRPGRRPSSLPASGDHAVPSSCNASSWVVVMADPDRILDAILAGKRERVSCGGQCTLRRQPFRAASRKQPQEPSPFGIRGFNTERTVVHVSESASVAAGMQERRLALWLLYGQRAFASPAGG
jgi:hypothetical protein